MAAARAVGGGGQGSGGGDNAGGGRGGAPAGQNAQNARAPGTGRDLSKGLTARSSRDRHTQSGATTIDALFGPLPQVESRGRAWLYIDKKLKPINLRLGVSDGTFTEILSGEVQQGQEVVTAMVTGLEPKTGDPEPEQRQQPADGSAARRSGAAAAAVAAAGVLAVARASKLEASAPAVNLRTFRNLMNRKL